MLEGGTGWILEKLAKIHPKGLDITYVEVAPAMIAQSKKRNAGGNEVILINDAIEEVKFTDAFDVVITPFLFDNFKETNLNTIFGSIDRILKPGGRWLNASFQLTGKWWQQILLRSMFLFFRLVCNIEASQLPKIKDQFQSNNYITIINKTFFGDFINSGVYRK